MLQRAASNAYSWWWASHIRTKQSKWLEQNLQDFEEKVASTMKLIEEEGDSFAKKAQMYYNNRPLLIIFVQESYRSYRSLAERYDHLSTELQKANTTIATIFPEQIRLAMEEEDEYNALKNEKKLPKMGSINAPKAPAGPVRELKSMFSNATKKHQAKEASNLPKPAGSKVTKVHKSGLSKTEGLDKIDKLQREILVLQTEKEFLKSSYEHGVKKYRGIEQQIVEMQQEVFKLQDEFSDGMLIQDEDARTLMASSALKSCQDALTKLQKKQDKAEKEAEKEHDQIKTAREKFESLCDEFLPEGERSSSGDDNKPQRPLKSKELKREMERLCQEIKEHFDSSEGSSLTVSEMAEKIDELVTRVINLESDISNETALLQSLKAETGDLQAEIQILEDDRPNLEKGLKDLTRKFKEMDKKMKMIEEIDRKVRDKSNNLQMSFTEARCNLGHLSQKLSSLKPDEELNAIAEAPVIKEKKPKKSKKEKGERKSKKKKKDKESEIVDLSQEKCEEQEAKNTENSIQNDEIEAKNAENSNQNDEIEEKNSDQDQDDEIEVKEPVESQEQNHEIKDLELDEIEVKEPVESQEQNHEIEDLELAEIAGKMENSKLAEDPPIDVVLVAQKEQTPEDPPSEVKAIKVLWVSREEQIPEKTIDVNPEEIENAIDTVAEKTLTELLDAPPEKVIDAPPEEVLDALPEEVLDALPEKAFDTPPEKTLDELPEKAPDDGPSEKAPESPQEKSLLTLLKEDGDSIQERPPDDDSDEDIFHDVESGTDEEEYDEPNWRELFLDVQKRLFELEKKSQDGLFDTTLQLRELKNANSMKEEEIRTLRQKLKHLQAKLDAMEDTMEDTTETKPETLQTPRPSTKVVDDEEDEYDMKFLLQAASHEISETEQKLRGDIDELLEENLDFWLRFSTSFHQIQKYETEIQDLKADTSKIIKEKRGEGSNTRRTSIKAEARSIYKHLSEIKAELNVWQDTSSNLKEELQSRFSSICCIQEEITNALKDSAEDEDFKFTTFQAAKFQGEILNMKQENNKVKEELQAGSDHMSMIQAQVEKCLTKLNDEFGFAKARNPNRQLDHSESRNRVPFRSFIFGMKPKKQTTSSFFSGVSPALNKYNIIKQVQL